MWNQLHFEKMLNNKLSNMEGIFECLPINALPFVSMFSLSMSIHSLYIYITIYVYFFLYLYPYWCQCPSLYPYPILIHLSCCVAVVCHRRGRLFLEVPAVFTGKVSALARRCLINSLSKPNESILKLTFVLISHLPSCPSGQLISATTEEIVKAYYPSYFLLSVAGQIQTRQAQANYDDSYLGKSARCKYMT